MNNSKNLIIIGAGKAGVLLRKDIEKNHPDCKIIGFVDDKKKATAEINVLGKIEDMSKIIDLYQVDEIIIAIPSADGALVRKILLSNLSNRVPVKIVPRDQRVISLSDVSYKEVHDLDLEDFLGRPFLKKNIEELKKFYRGKKILVTGGAGSIGSEIVKQLLDLEVKKVIVYDNSEYMVFNLDQRLKEEKFSQERYEIIIGSILNSPKLDYVIKSRKPDAIFHAAAYKHVYLMEDNIDEAIHNNVLGTKNVVDLAVKNKIKQFVFISTDKVVNPTSVMGATKKLCEYYIKAIPLSGTRTRFTIVRFGNVINSNGSVLPLFERQMKELRYVTVTHKEVKRFFMSIREAARLVIHSATKNSKGEIFILDMGELINIFETAQCLIRSKNLLPCEDIEIKIIGLKKGEKLIEELFTSTEQNNLVKSDMKDILCLKNFERCSKDINLVFEELSRIVAGTLDEKKIKDYLCELFPNLKIK